MTIRSVHFSVLLFATLTAAPALAQVTGQVDLGAGAVINDPQRSYYLPGPNVGASVFWNALHLVDFGASAGFVFTPRNTESSPLEGPGSAFRIGLVARLRPPLETSRYLPFVELGGGFVQTGSLPRVGLQAGAGMLFRVGEKFFLGPKLGYEHIFKLEGVPDFRTVDASLVTLSLAFEFPLVSTVPEVVSDQTDTDGDAVIDSQDQCLTQRGPAPTGCPDQDPDRDGVKGSLDRCPTEAEDPDDFEDGDGCPDLDDDGDGTMDVTDACRRVPGPRELKGCPDTDGDSVSDPQDQCPKVAGAQENRGCPLYKTVVVKDDHIELGQKIFFAFGLAAILPRSDLVLLDVAQALKDRPGLCARIEGHTDNVGKPERNLALSDERARAVRQYLVTQGLDGKSLNARGYGQTLPLETNGTPEGRERNRRVEFVIVPCESLEKRP